MNSKERADKRRAWNAVDRALDDLIAAVEGVGTNIVRQEAPNVYEAYSYAVRERYGAGE